VNNALFPEEPEIVINSYTDPNEWNHDFTPYRARGKNRWALD
jgi:hypothetical protein